MSSSASFSDNGRVSEGTYHLARPSAGVVVVELFGEHDLATQEELNELFDLLLERNNVVVIDVSETDFIDSSVLVNLTRADRLAKERRKVFRLQLGTAAIVRKALEVSGVLDTLVWAETREEVLIAEPETQPSG